MVPFGQNLQFVSNQRASVSTCAKKDQPAMNVITLHMLSVSIIHFATESL